MNTSRNTISMDIKTTTPTTTVASNDNCRTNHDDTTTLVLSGRGFRQRKKQTEPSCCPVCGITLRTNEEIEAHYIFEIERLHKLPQTRGKHNTIGHTNRNSHHHHHHHHHHHLDYSSNHNETTTTTNECNSSKNCNNTLTIPGGSCSSSTNSNSNSSCSTSSSSSNSGTPQQPPWELFRKVRLNRQNRHKSRTNRKRKYDLVLCPICNQETSDEIISHVEHCLKRLDEPNGCSSSSTSFIDHLDIDNNGLTNLNHNNHHHSDENDDDVVDDGENDVGEIDVEAFEEYEWAGQSRIRATSYLPPDQLGTVITNHLSNSTDSGGCNEDDEDLNVDEDDDTRQYGNAQYTEKDIILLPGNDDNLALRKAVIDGDVSKITVVTNSTTSTIPTTKTILIDDDCCTSSSSTTNRSLHISTPLKNCNNTCPMVTGDPIIQVLKNRIKEMEKRMNDTYKCLICMDRYKTPVISVCCWHVYCEKCWLQSLGVKKLCPQCNMITSPNNLRRIFI